MSQRTQQTDTASGWRTAGTDKGGFRYRPCVWQSGSGQAARARRQVLEKWFGINPLGVLY